MVRLLAVFCIAWPVVALSEESLPSALKDRLELRNIPSDAVSLYVHDLDSGDTLIEWAADQPRNPASTIKLVTTLVGLDVLGPAYRWKTEVYALGPIVDGRLDGDLLIKGYGDPFLVTDRVWQMLRLIRQEGIDTITGDLILDDSHFDVADEDPGAFDRQPLRAYNVPPNALLMNFKVVRYRFAPDVDDNSVDVQIEPPLDNLTVENRLSLATGACRGFQRGIAISANDAINRMTLEGRFPNGCNRYSMSRTALDHAEFAYGLFSSLWHESGGVFNGNWQPGTAPEDSEPLLRFRSLTLSELIARINKHSNNVMARQLLYTLGAETRGAPGTEQGGLDAIRAWFEERGLPTDAFVMDNGAGLSRDARMSARLFGEMLAHAWSRPYMPEFLASMSMLGLDGTTRGRMDIDRLKGMAHLKTGSLDDVSAIAGYMQSHSGRRFAVALLLNHKDVHRGPGDEAHIALLNWLYDL